MDKYEGAVTLSTRGGPVGPEEFTVYFAVYPAEPPQVNCDDPTPGCEAHVDMWVDEWVEEPNEEERAIVEAHALEEANEHGVD